MRYRLTLWQQTTPFLPAVIMTTAVSIPSAPDVPDVPPPGGLTGLVTFWIVLLALGPALSFRFGITLTPTAAVVHNLRRRTIPWSGIQGVQIESVLGTRSVVLYEAGGRRTVLRAPQTAFLSWDRHFEEKFHVVGEWWLSHRGPDWTPVPPPRTWWNTPSA